MTYKLRRITISSLGPGCTRYASMVSVGASALLLVLHKPQAHKAAKQGTPTGGEDEPLSGLEIQKDRVTHLLMASPEVNGDGERQFDPD